MEQAPAALRAPSAGVCAAFVSDRQKHETAPADSPLTKIVLGALRLLGMGCGLEQSGHGRQGSVSSAATFGVALIGQQQALAIMPCAGPNPHICSSCLALPAERTAHLRPGSQFIKSFWMTEGVRCTNTSVVRCAGRAGRVCALDPHSCSLYPAALAVCAFRALGPQIPHSWLPCPCPAPPATGTRCTRSTSSP